MLFDLRGRRRRAVQATYLTLALLMGGGLVFFGIGGDVSGGLFDAFSERGGDGNGNSLVEKRIETNEKRLRTSPRNEAALKALTRDYFQLANSETETGQVGFPKGAHDELRNAGSFWQRYLAVEEGKPDASLATVAFQIFDVGALNRPKHVQRAAQIIAEAQNEPEAYIRVVQYATLAGDTRTADLAGQKAIDLASKDERKLVKEQVEQAKQTQLPQTGQGGAQ